MPVRFTRARRRGATMVECAVVLPITFFLVFAIIVGGLGVFRYQQAATMARDGARYVCVHGSQYASARHRQLLKDLRMTPSMSRVGNCWDNAAMESFFKTLKVERVYQTRYATRAQARLDIVDWIEGFYNRQRRHSAINYQTPVAAEALMAA